MQFKLGDIVKWRHYKCSYKVIGIQTRNVNFYKRYILANLNYKKKYTPYDEEVLFIGWYRYDFLNDYLCEDYPKDYYKDHFTIASPYKLLIVEADDKYLRLSPSSVDFIENL